MPVAIPIIAAYAATTAAVAAGIVVAGGIGAALIGAGVSMLVAHALRPDTPPGPGNSLIASGGGRTQQIRQPIAAHQVIAGRIKTSGPILFIHSGPDDDGRTNGYMYLIHALAGHQTRAIADVFLDDNLSTDARYTGLVTVNLHTGADNQTADTTFTTDIGAVWTANHRLRGITYIASRLKFDANAFPAGLPNIAAIVEGVADITDFRDAQVRWTNNPALFIAWWMMSPLGMNLETTDLDLDSVIAAANVCDERVRVLSALDSSPPAADTTATVDEGSPDTNTLMLADGSRELDYGFGIRVSDNLPTGLSADTTYYVIPVAKNQIQLASSHINAIDKVPITLGDNVGTISVYYWDEPRYLINGLFTVDQARIDILQGMLSAMAGVAVYVGGKWFLHAGAPATPTITLSEDDLRAEMTMIPKRSMRDRFNAVRAVYVSPDAHWQPVDAPPVSIISEVVSVNPNTDFTAATLPASSTWAYGLGYFAPLNRWVANAGAAGPKAYSDDGGATWQSGSGGTNSGGPPGMLCNDVCCIMGVNGTGVERTTDGITWSDVAMFSIGGAGTNSGCVAPNGDFVIITSFAGAARVWTSPDGNGWSIQPAPPTESGSNDIQCMAASDTRIVAVSSKAGGATNTAWYSDNNGVSWTPVTLPSTQIWRNIISNGREFMLFCQGTVVLTSPTGETGSWTQKAADHSADWLWGASALLGGGVLVNAVGENDGYFTTDDGDTWTLVDFTVNAAWRRIATDGYRWVVISTSDNDVVYSSGIAQFEDLLYRDLRFPFTISGRAVQRLMKIELERNLRERIIQFPAKLTAFRLLPWDGVYLDHERYGFVAEQHRVMGWVLSDDGGVDLSLQADDSDVYAWDRLTDEREITATQDVTFPDGSLAAPVIAVGVGLGFQSLENPDYLTIRASWSAPIGAISYDAYYRESGGSPSSDWILVGRITDNFFEVASGFPPDVGAIDFRARSVGSSGQVSAYGENISPGMPTDVAFSPSSITWTNGANAALVQVFTNSTDDFGSSSFVTTANGPGETYSPPADGYYWLRSINTAGNVSVVSESVLVSGIP